MEHPNSQTSSSFLKPSYTVRRLISPGYSANPTLRFDTSLPMPPRYDRSCAGSAAGSPTGLYSRPPENLTLLAAQPASKQPRIKPGTYVAFSLSTEAIARWLTVQSAEADVQEKEASSVDAKTFVQENGAQDLDAENATGEDGARGANGDPPTTETQGTSVQEIIKKFPVRRYVGLVTWSGICEPNNEADEPIEELLIHYVAPVPPPIPSVENHWIPISTKSKESDRPPLDTKAFFPWNDAKQWTTLGIRAIVENLHASSLEFTLEDEHMEMFDELAVEDYEDKAEKMDDLRLEEAPELWQLGITESVAPVDIWFDVRKAGGIWPPAEFVAEMRMLGL
jgi:hypothetical protein